MRLIHIAESRAPDVTDYIRAAEGISSITRNVVLPDLVAEARASGVPWSKIGESLGIGTTAAQKRFGEGLDPGRLEELAREKQVVSVTNSMLSQEDPNNDPAWSEVLKDLEGTTPLDRLKYAAELIRSASIAFSAAMDSVKLSDGEPDLDQFVKLLHKAYQKVTLVAATIIPDPGQWGAVVEWSEVPDSPDRSHYESPATYLFCVLRNMMLATDYCTQALKSQDSTFDEKMESFEAANTVLQASMLLLTRPDVALTIPHE